MIFQFILEIYVYSQNNDKNKINLPPPSFTVFLMAKKLATLLRLKNVKTFSDFQLVLGKIKSNCMCGLLCIANFLKVGRKETFFYFYGFWPPLNPNEVK